jgi:polyhydroxybutyrate depolymerase
VSAAPETRTRHGWHPTDTLEHAWLEVGGARRSYWLARAPQPDAPILVALHGSGTTGENLAAFTGLAVRGPATGVTVALPDGRGQTWYAGSATARRAAANDGSFLAALVARLAAEGGGRGNGIALLGLSNGAFFAEQLARTGVLPLATLVLVAGTALEWSRRASPEPARPARVVCLAGTADPLVAYEGGRLGGRGVFAWWVRRRRTWVGADEAVAVGAAPLARDWARANRAGGDPAEERLPAAPGDLPVTRLFWSAPGALPVELYRIEGGGHGWPGGPQYLPARLIGPIARTLDATGLVLAAAGF